MTVPSAHKASRIDAVHSPDFFPTAPWATRALCELLLGLDPHGENTCWDLVTPPILPLPESRALLERLDGARAMSVWEPACGQGHMALPLAEYFPFVFASDLFDRGFGPFHGPHWDFLGLDPTAQHEPGTFDWIITNPPYRDYAQRFVERAFLHRPRKGIAVFVQLRWLETIDRTLELFLPFRPWMIGVFSERVPLLKNRYDPEASTATAYIWVIWRTDIRVEDTVTRWIPPGQSKRLFRKRDLLLARPAPEQQDDTPLPLLEAGRA
jgi:hypothetical protein